MFSAVMAEVDLIEELRLRRWARENYVPSELCVRSWHPVILDEMLRRLAGFLWLASAERAEACVI